MPKPVPPVLSVIVRRFRREFADDIEPAIHHIQKAAAGQPGFIGLQNSITPKRDDCELVTVITFDTPANLEKWENSPARKRFVLELDNLSQDDATNTRFNGLSLLAHPTAQISKAETVLILIAWILVLSNLLPYPLDYLLPDLPAPFWRNVLLTTVIVVLISYVLLPVSSIVLTRFKLWLAGRQGT